MDEKNVLFEILRSREQRVETQKNLIKAFGVSLVSFTLNIPGPHKDSVEYRLVHSHGMEALLNQLSAVVHVETKYLSTGPEGFVSVDMDPLLLKKICIGIERNHEFGRLFDMDVLDKSLRNISRLDIGDAERKCLICNKEVSICRREKNHTLEELTLKINRIITKNL